MKRIFLVRHCKARGQESTAELTDEGLVQAEVLADFFTNREIEFIISSPFERAVSTIRPFSEKVKLDIHIADQLSERMLSLEDRADWMDRLKESFMDLDMKLPSGESSREAMDRGVGVIRSLLDRIEKNIIVVTHGNLMSLILKHFGDSFGFEDWRGLTNPDVYELCRLERTEEIRVKRLWK